MEALLQSLGARLVKTSEKPQADSCWWQQPYRVRLGNLLLEHHVSVTDVDDGRL